MINKYKDRVFTNNKNLEFKIIYYKDTNNVIVEFIKTGYFKSSTEAFNAYKEAKENYLKQLAEKWKDKIDPRAYHALINYTVEITD